MFQSHSDHLLKLLILKFVKNVKVNVLMQQYNVNILD